MMTEQLSQALSLAASPVVPQTLNNSTQKTGGVDMNKFHRALFVVTVGSVAAGGSLSAKLQESVDTTDGNFTDVSGGAITQLLAAGGDNRSAILEIDAAKLTAGKKYTRVKVTVGTAASLVTAFALGVDPVQKPGSQNNDTSVAQRLVV